MNSKIEEKKNGNGSKKNNYQRRDDEAVVVVQEANVFGLTQNGHNDVRVTVQNDVTFERLFNLLQHWPVKIKVQFVRQQIMYTQDHGRGATFCPISVFTRDNVSMAGRLFF